MIAAPFDENDPNARTLDPVDPPAAPPAAPAQPQPVAPAVAPAPASPWNREQFRDAWMSTGSDATRQNALLAQHNLTPDGAGRVTLPTGEVIDLRLGARAGGTQATWTGVGPTAGPGAGGMSGMQGGGEGGFGVQGGSSAGGFQDQMRAMLMKILGQSQGPVDPNGADVKVPFDAASLDAQRQLEAEQKALAESQYAEGNGSRSNELQQSMQQSRERTAVGLAGLKGQLLQRAQQMQMQKMQQALALAVQSGDAESARAIQLQIAQMGNALGYSQLSQQGSQWNDRYGLDVADAQYQRDRDAARAKAGLPF